MSVAGVATAAEPASPALPASTLLPGCPVDAGPAWPDLPPADPDDKRVEVFTGRAEMDLNAGALFDKQILIRRGQSVLSAPGGIYDEATGRFDLKEGLAFRDPQAAISGRSAYFDTLDDKLRIDEARFQILSVPSRGTASVIEVEQSRLLQFKDVTYTTCAEGNEDWVMRAASIEINRDTGMAKARDARLEFKGVPILYTPWIAYPVTNERTTGFLLPAIGRSESRGLEFQIPFYLNLAPNYDATLTPRYMSQRGLELQSELRYIWTGTDGQIDAEYLPNDDATDEDRYFFGIDQQSLLGAGWRATVDAETVSDTRFFEDLGNSLSATSQTNLERVLTVENYGDSWAIMARLQDYENLDESLTPTEKPYRRVPQIAASGFVPDGFLGLDWDFVGDLSVFERNAGPTGSRLHLNPGISLPMTYRGLRIDPSASVEHTAYSIENPDPGEPDGPSRTTPIFSVDTTAVFERGLRGGDSWIQTLEPRVQYVHIPYRDQDDLPVFDTIQPDFNMVQLFRQNRFLGYDRIGDTDRLNIGLTTRFLDANDGTQYLTATVGEALFLSDREVTLPGETPSDSNSSDWLAELGLNFWRHWKVDLGFQWDDDDGETESTQARVQYRQDSHRVINLAYRYRRDTVDEIDVSAAWPLSARWSAVGRYDYSILDSKVLESFAGLEYQNCCWGLRVVYRNYVASRSGDTDTAIAVQLILKGFTNVGDSADRLLERGILGYEAD